MALVVKLLNESYQRTHFLISWSLKICMRHYCCAEVWKKKREDNIEILKKKEEEEEEENEW